jgi:hypothetical protein
MVIAINRSFGWHCVATFEVIGKVPCLDAVLGNTRHHYQIEPSREAPAEHSWFDVLVDFSFGERRAWHVAYAILTALQDVADEGLIEGYRLVTGQFYFAADHACAETPDEQREPLTGEPVCA